MLCSFYLSAIIILYNMNQRLVSNRKSHVVADIQDKTTTFTWPVENVMTNIGKSLLSWVAVAVCGKTCFVGRLASITDLCSQCQ